MVILTLAGLLLGITAASLSYLAHRNQRWRGRPLPRALQVVAATLAALALFLLCRAMGIGPGLITALCLFQLAALSMPYLAWWRGAPQ